MIVVPTLECGGLERNVAILCNNIDNEQFDVTLVVINNVKQFFPITNPGVKLIDLRITNVRKSLFSILKLSRKIKPAIILTTANHLNLLFAMFKWLFPKNIKIIARESSIVSINTQHSWNPRLFNSLLRNFYKRLDMIVCQSRYMQQDLVKNYAVNLDRTCIIYNAVTIPGQIVSSSNKAEAELITVGRLSKEKGMDRLIRAVAHLKIPFRFTIIGDGHMRDELQKLINDLSLEQKVFLAGSSDRPFSMIANPDLFLMGSHYEGFPNAMLEASALGIPVVAFNAPGGIAELIVNEENGILVDSDSEQEFAKAIQRALSHGFNNKRIQESTLKRFNIEAVMTQWYELFRS